MSAYDLPKSVNVCGVEYAIRTDYRDIIEILIAMDDNELDDRTKTYVLLKIMFPDFEKIPPEHLEECGKKACEFISHGVKNEDKNALRLMDWEQDATLISAAVNSVAHTDVRAVEYLHWWTFLSWYMEIRHSLFTEVINIRTKKAKGKKLEKAEQEFYKENKSLIDLNKKERSEEEKNALRALFGIKK